MSNSGFIHMAVSSDWNLETSCFSPATTVSVGELIQTILNLGSFRVEATLSSSPLMTSME